MNISKDEYVGLEKAASFADLNDILVRRVSLNRASMSVIPDDLSISSLTKKFEKDDELYVDLQIKVTDTGVGISPEGISKLFIDFSRL